MFTICLGVMTECRKFYNTNLNSMHGDSGQLSLILIQYTVTLVSGSLLIIEKMKVLIIFVTLVYFAFSCEECDYPFSNYATCTGETVCVYGAENVQVECWMRDITTDTVIKQLFVRGDCNILHFKQFCSRGVEIIEMVNSNDNLSCSGNPPLFSAYFLVSRKRLRNSLRCRVHR